MKDNNHDKPVVFTQSKIFIFALYLATYVLCGLLFYILKHLNLIHSQPIRGAPLSLLFCFPTGAGLFFCSNPSSYSEPFLTILGSYAAHLFFIVLGVSSKAKPLYYIFILLMILNIIGLSIN